MQYKIEEMETLGGIRQYNKEHLIVGFIVATGSEIAPWSLVVVCSETL